MTCACGCGRPVTSTDPRTRYAAPACRVRACAARARAKRDRREQLAAERAGGRDLATWIASHGPTGLLVGGHVAPLHAHDVGELVALAELARRPRAWRPPPRPRPPRASSCACGCGAAPVARGAYAGGACRVRAIRARRAAVREQLDATAAAARAGQGSALALLPLAVELGLSVAVAGRRGVVTLSADEVASLALTRAELSAALDAPDQGAVAPDAAPR